MKSIFYLFFSAIVFSIIACGNDAPQKSIIEVNKKMPLLEWPDSVYIAALDSILALEPVKKDAKNKPNIAMNAHKAPTFMLPGSVTGKKDTKKTSRDMRKGESAGKGLPASQQTKGFGSGAEAFSDKFLNAMSALQSDPNNKNLYKVVIANDEDLTTLLKRTYGAGAQNLPRFYVLSTLQSVNPGVMLEHLHAGDKVRVPKI